METQKKKNIYEEEDEILHCNYIYNKICISSQCSQLSKITSENCELLSKFLVILEVYYLRAEEQHLDLIRVE